MESTIAISVVMPSYNTPIPILKEAVDSILNQSFRDFEFLIIDDCSTDDSVAYLQSLTDERIRLIRNPQNLGITKTLNVGLRAAKGKYIARMDSDDISLPDRFAKQFAYMESNPDVVMCGSRVEKFGDEQGSGVPPIEDMELYRARLLFCYPGPLHPTIFLRHETLLQHHITYDERLRFSQDYALYTVISQYGKIYFSRDVLLRYRTHAGQVSSSRREMQVACAKEIQRPLLTALLGQVSEEELDFHYRYSASYSNDTQICPEISDWYEHLAKANMQKQIYDPKKFRQTINFVKRRLILATLRNEPSVWRKARVCFRYLPPLAAAKVFRRTLAGTHRPRPASQPEPGIKTKER